MRCCICDAETPEPEQAAVRCNVRRFADEQFHVWRCAQCASLHARDEVDLDHYYADYPFHHFDDMPSTPMLRVMYDNQRARLARFGIGPSSSILDYGCGSGAFLGFLREAGFEDAHGFDAYHAGHDDPAVLERRYDCVLTQDVIEHVPDPRALVQTLHGLVRPGGLVFIGTPNAEAVDLSDPEAGIHSLHQPYHRHVLSRRALCELGGELGWELVHCFDTMYSNTRVPFVNAAFLQYYFRCFDNNVDLALDPPRFDHWALWTPKSLWLGLFGYYFPPSCDAMAVYRRPTRADASVPKLDAEAAAKGPDGGQTRDAAIEARAAG
jgi:SAM-dependent methyltransferase